MASWENGEEERNGGGYSYSEEVYEQPYLPTLSSDSNFEYSTQNYSQDSRASMAAQSHRLSQLDYDLRFQHLNAQSRAPVQSYQHQPESQSGFFPAYPTAPPPALIHGRSTLYAQSESFGVPATGSSLHPRPHLPLPEQAWSNLNHYHSPQQPPPARAYGYYNYPAPHSAYPSPAYCFSSPQSTPSSSFTTRPRTYTNDSSAAGSTDGTSASSCIAFGQHSALGDARGAWDASGSLPFAEQQEQVNSHIGEEPFADGASQEDGASVEPTSPFRSHAAVEARDDFLLEGEHDELSSLTQDERFFFETSQERGVEVGAVGGYEVEADSKLVAEQEPNLEQEAETESEQLRFAEQLFGMRMYGAGARGGGGYGAHLSSSPEPADFGDVALQQPSDNRLHPSPQQCYSSASDANFNFNPEYPSARAIAHSSTAPRYHSPAVSPAQSRSSAKSLVSDSSSLTSLSSSSQSSSSVNGGPVSSKISQLETVSAPRAMSTSSSTLFGQFQESCRVFDDQGVPFDLQPEILPPAFTYDSKLAAWLGYRRNYLSLSASVVLPRSSSLLYLHSSTASAIKISHFIATTIALTLPTHLSVPLLQLDTTRKLERATSLQPSRFELPGSYIKTNKGGKATASFVRVQFRNSTANHPSGASSVDGMTTRFGMRVVVEAVMAEGGAKVEVGRWESGEVVIRGRSPKNFGIVTAKGKEMTAAAARAAVKGELKEGKSKTKPKAGSDGKGKKITPRDYSSSEEMDEEDLFLALFAEGQRRRSGGLSSTDAAGPSNSHAIEESDPTGKRSITWDDYDAETLTVAKRTRSSRR